MKLFSPSDIFKLDGVNRMVVDYVFVQHNDLEDARVKWGYETRQAVQSVIQRARISLASKGVRLPDRRVKLRPKYQSRFGRYGL